MSETQRDAHAVRAPSLTHPDPARAAEPKFDQGATNPSFSKGTAPGCAAGLVTRALAPAHAYDAD